MSVKAVTLNHLAKRKDLQKILTTADLHTGNLQGSPDTNLLKPHSCLTINHAKNIETQDDEGCLLTQVHNHTLKVDNFTSAVGRIISHIDSTQKINIHLAIQLEELYGKLQYEQDLT